MAEAGSSAREAVRGRILIAGTLIALLLVLLATAPAADAAVSRSAAAKKALAALGTGETDQPVIVFGLRKTLRPRSVVGQAGPGGGRANARAATRFGKARTKRIRNAGVDFHRPDVVLRTGSERTWFFYEDRGPHQNYEHPGRVVLVGARTGRVRTSGQLRWVPLVNGRQPAFFRSAENYESSSFRVFSRPWTTGPEPRARTRQAPASSAQQKVADALAAEKSCAYRISDTLGNFFDFGRVDKTRARLGDFFEGLEKLNAGFVSRRYTTKEGQTPVRAAQELIDEAGCRDLFIYTAGAASRTSDAAIVVGMRNLPGGGMEWHVLTAADLAALVDANPNVTFKFLFDAPYAGRVTKVLNGKPNVLVTLASSDADESSFLFVPEIITPGGLQRNTGNPNRFLEFTNAVINGVTAFALSDGEVDHALNNGSGVSMMVWMLVRGMGMSNAWMFSASSESMKLPPAVTPPGAPPLPPPPLLGAAPNRNPNPTTPAQPTLEDTAKSITLTANDPDGDALTFSIIDGPDHGDLTGTPPNLTYTPDQDFDGDDAFTYLVEDGRGGSNTQTVNIPITPDNDAAAVATTSGSGPTFTEDGAAVAIDNALTIADPDSTQLESATVAIVGGTLQAGDELVFVDQSGITGTYSSGTGVLTLTGNASASDYQAALRSVAFDSTQQNPTTSRTIEFTAQDGDEAGVPAQQTVTITPVNDKPVGATGATTAFSYTEGNGAVAPLPGATVSDVDDTMLEGATVAIMTGYVNGEDFLAFTDQNGITDFGFDASNGTISLTGTATVAQYEAAIRSITYENTSDNPSTGQRTIRFTVSDGALNSDGVSRALDVAPANDAPVVNTSAGDTAYTEGGAGTVIDGSLTVSDVDDANLEGAQVRVSSGFESGDMLTFADQGGITGAYNSTTGVLALSGSATKAAYQTALRSITFDNTADDNLTSPKTIEFKVNDGDADSNAATKNVAITGVNDAPTLDTTDAARSYTEGDGAVAVDNGITVSDPDSTSLAGATVQITSNFVQADDDLVFVDQNGITGSYDDSTGKLTLSGTASLANYQTALRSVAFQNLNDNPSGSKTVSFQVNDGAGANNLSNVATRDINLAGANDAPVVTTSAGSTTYSEGDPATTVDGALTVTDADDTNIEGGQVRISSNFQSGDSLEFADQNGITGLYNSTTGVLTLSGAASTANYQTALRSIKYLHTGDNPSAGKQVEFKVNDGDADSNAAVKGINLTGVNDVPTVNTSAGTTAYTEGGAAAAVDSALTISDPDDTSLDSGQVRISSGFQTGDTLVFTDQNGIIGSYASGTGVLTLSTPSGEASVADWQAALRSIQFSTTNDDPTTSREVEFKVNDGGGDSNTPTKSITITPANDAPAVTTSGGNTSYTEGDAATAVDGALTIGDADDTNIESGQVRISNGFQSGDQLDFADQNGISGNYTPGTGVLTLTGQSSVANYQTALRSIKFQTSNDAPGTSKTVEFKVNDGDVDSNLATKGLSLTPVNDGPTLDTTDAPLSYTEGDGAVAVDNGLTASDPDSTQLQGATVQITGNHVQADDELAFSDQNGISGSYNDSTGKLTLSGTTSLANYQTALRSVTYQNGSDNPTGSKTVSFQATDAGGAASNVATRDINLSGANDAPVVTTSGGSTSYSEGGPATAVDGALTVTDADDTNIESAQVRISNNFQPGDTLEFTDTANITGNYTPGTGVLTLTGSDLVANYRTALRSIKFQTSNDNPSSSKTVEFKVNDGDVDSNLATKSLAITGVNDAPTVTTSGGSAAFVEDTSGPVAVDPNLTLSDPDSVNLQGATVQLQSYTPADDELLFTDTATITGSYNATDGKLTLTGTDTVANYQAALRSVRYDNGNSDSPDTSTRTAQFKVKDAEGAESNTATRGITVSLSNDAPVVTTSAGSTAYTEGAVATNVDNAITVTDADDTDLEGGEVRISNNFQVGDVLTFAPQNGISGVYNPTTGELTLSGTSSVANYQTALRSITYSHVGDNPASSKTVEFTVNDGDSDSNAAVKGLNVTGVNDGPTVNTSAGTTAFVEDTSGPVDVDSALTVSDPDSANLSGATVSITTNFNSSEDVLAFTDQNGITGAYNSGTGVLTLSGTASVANYQAALRSVEYNNTDTVAPSTATRTVTFQATDSSAAPSNSPTKDVSVASVNDAPVVTTTAGSTPYTEDDPATTIDGGLTISDQDDTDLEGGQVRISSGFQTGDSLEFTDQNGITGNYTPGTGVLTLTGAASVANYQTALRSIQFQSTNQQPVTSKTVEFKVNDGDVDSNLATKELAVTPTNDAPIVNATDATLAYTENDPATAVDSGLTIDDTENDNLSGGSASLTANYAAGQDFLAWTDNNLADNITLDGINSSAQTVVLTGLDTDANYQAALRAVTYQNNSNNPTTSNRTITFSATDQPGLTGSDTRTVSVTAVDDPPTAVSDSATLLEDAAATSIPVLTNDTDVDGGPKTISSATDPANGTVVLTGGSPGAHTGLTYQPDPNYCNDPPATTPDTFQYTVNGGSNATVSMTVTCVNDAPVADDETFNGNNSAHGNTTMQVDDPDDDKSAPTNPHTEITGDILAGDTDIDGPGPLLVQTVGRNLDNATPGTGLTNDGGTVTAEPDGDFVYQPAPSTSCTDTSDFFDYKVRDNGSPEQTDTGRVTIAIAGCVWYVKNNAPTGAGNNDGSSDTPFVTLAQAETASGTNHTVFVFDGDNTATGYDAGGYTMDPGERLIGEHEGLTVDPDQGGSLTADTLHPANGGAHPTITSSTNTDVVDLSNANEIRGFNIDPQGTGGGIFGTAGDVGATIDDVNIVEGVGTTGTGPGVELLNINAGSTTVFTNFTVDNDATGVLLNNARTVDFGGDTGVVTLNSNGAPALAASAGSGGTDMNVSHFDDIIVTNSSNGAVDMDGTTGTTHLGDGSGTDLNLTTTSGAEPALDLNNAGTITVDAGGIDEIHATGGPAADITATSGATFNFEDVDSTSSSTDGINIDGLGAGTFFADNASSITGASGIAFDLNGGSGLVDYNGTIANGPGETADITGRTGNTNLDGAISDSGDADAGAENAINVSGNTAGTTSITAGTKTLNVGEDTAIGFTGNSSHTLSLTGGGLDIDTTSGNGLNASNTSGTLEVTTGGSPNTIDSTALAAGNRALNISDTSIGNSDVTFRHVNSTGGLNGIRVNNSTNAGGRLFLTSTGSGACTSAATCTGGAIQTASGSGVILTNLAGGAEFMRLGVIDSADHGIHATSVDNGILLDRSYIFSNGNAGGGTGENGLDWFDVHGVTAIRHSDLIGTGNLNEGGFDARIANTTGTLNLTVNDNDFNLAGTEDGLQVGTPVAPPGSTGTIRTSITGNRFNDNKGDAIQIVDGPTSSGFTSDHTITGNTIDGKAGVATDGGIAVSSDGSSRVTVSNNTVTSVSVSGIILNPAGSSTGTTVHMTANNNTVGTAGVQISGAEDGDGMQLKSDGDGTAKVQMNGNVLHGWQGAGMRLRASETTSGAVTNLTAQNNTVGTEENDGVGGVAASAGIYLQAGSLSTDVLRLCADVGGAGTQNTLVNPPVDNDAIADFVLDLRFANARLRVPNYVAPASSYFLGRNTGFTTFAQDGIQNPASPSGGEPCDFTAPTAPNAPTAPPAVGP